MTPAGSPDTTSLGTELRALRDSGRKALVMYVTAGLPGLLDVVEAIMRAGADVVEIGVPFSDPIMDGPVIQQASQRALDLGATPSALLDELATRMLPKPTVVMTYANIVAAPGFDQSAKHFGAAGVRGAIIPDLPYGASGEWSELTDALDIANVLLVAPTTPDDRLSVVANASRGFVYGIGLLGVTGERDTVADSALVIGKRVKAVTSQPVFVGIGVSNGAAAKQVAHAADGVIVGSALVRRMLEGESPEQVALFVGSLRSAIDAR